MLETASWGRRVLALIVDWLACTLIVVGFLGPAGWSADPLAGTYALLLYLLENTILTATMGGSFGQLLTRLRVVRYDAQPGPEGRPPRPPSILNAALRSALICLVIPPLVFRADGRGLHDMAAGTAAVPFRP